MEIIFFDNSVKKVVANLESGTKAKVFRLTNLLKEFGENLGMPYSKRIEKNLFELRVRGKQEVRIFYTFKEGAVFLHAFIKKTQKIPIKELKVVRRKLRSIDEK